MLFNLSKKNFKHLNKRIRPVYLIGTNALFLPMESCILMNGLIILDTLRALMTDLLRPFIML